jgi:hypothetical protein
MKSAREEVKAEVYRQAFTHVPTWERLTQQIVDKEAQAI